MGVVAKAETGSKSENEDMDQRPEFSRASTRIFFTANSLAVTVLISFGVCPILSAQESRPLKVGWYDWEPYQYERVVNGQRVLSGLDIEMLQAIGKRAKLNMTFEHHSFDAVLAGLQDGSIDLTIGYRRSEREVYARYSFPYRLETEVILVRRGSARRFPSSTLSELLKSMRGKTKIGAVTGYVYGPRKFSDFLNDPANRQFIS